VLHRLVRVHEDETRRPAVFAGQLAEGGQHARRRFQRKAFDGDDLDELAADLRHDAGPQFLPTDERIQVHRVARQLHRMIDAGDAELQPAQEVIVGDFRSVLVDHLGGRAAAVSSTADDRRDSMLTHSRLKNSIRPWVCALWSGALASSSNISSTNLRCASSAGNQVSVST
jgi:hypothetical protein